MVDYAAVGYGVLYSLDVACFAVEKAPGKGLVLFLDVAQVPVTGVLSGIPLCLT